MAVHAANVMGLSALDVYGIALESNRVSESRVQQWMVFLWNLIQVLSDTFLT